MRRSCAIALTIAFCALTVTARDTTKELTVDLKFVPQEGVHASTADLTPSITAQSFAVKITDGRGGADPLVIGEGTNDDDKLFPIRAASDPLPYIAATSEQVLTSWGLKSGSPAERVLQVRVARFYVNESNKAMGSVYGSEVKFSYVLSDATGKTLFEGASSGTAHRYGRARSAPNCNEVLSDALKEAVANMFADQALQTAWASGKPASTAGGNSTPAVKESVEERLKKLDDLLKKGLITKDEYQKRRAEILKEI